MDVKGRKSHGVEEDTSSNTDRVGSPFLKGRGIFARTEAIDLHGKAAHESFNVTRSDKPNRASRWVEVDGERSGILLESAVKRHEALETAKRPVKARDKADATSLVVWDKELLLSMAAVLLDPPLDPHVSNAGKGVVQYANPNGTAQGKGLDTDINRHY